MNELMLEIKYIFMIYRLNYTNAELYITY